MESINKLRYPKYVLGNILVVLALLLPATQADSGIDIFSIHRTFVAVLENSAFLIKRNFNLIFLMQMHSPASTLKK